MFAASFCKIFGDLVVMSHDVAFHQTISMKTRDIIGRNRVLMHFFMAHDDHKRFNHKKNLVLDDVLPTGLALPGTRNLSTQEYMNVC